MNNASLLTADRKTHLKIVVVSLVCATLIAGIGVANRLTLSSAGRADRDDGRQGCQAGDGRYRREPHHPLSARAQRPISATRRTAIPGGRVLAACPTSYRRESQSSASERSAAAWGVRAPAQASKAQAGLPLRGSPVTTRPRPPAIEKDAAGRSAVSDRLRGPEPVREWEPQERPDAEPPDAVQPGAPRARRWQEPYWPRSYPDPPTGTDQVPAAETAMRFRPLLAALNGLSPGRPPAQALRLSTPA